MWVTSGSETTNHNHSLINLSNKAGPILEWFIISKQIYLSAQHQNITVPFLKQIV